MRARLESAYRAHKEGDFPQAVALCRDALRLDPDNVAALSLLGRLYEALGERDLAAQAYERVVQLNPGSIADRVQLDELRGDPASSGGHRVPQPSGVTSGQNGAYVLGLIGACAALMVLGGVFALHWFGPDRRIEQPDPSIAAGKKASATPFDGGRGVATSEMNNASGPAAVNNGATLSSRESTAGNTAAPSYSWPLGAPPVIIYDQTPPARTLRSSASFAATPPPALAAVHVPRQTRTTSTGSGGRLILPAEDVADDGQGNVTIKVSGDKKGAAAARSDTPRPPVMHVEVGHSDASDATGNDGSSSGRDALTYIGIGDTHQENREYDKAIAAYKRALTGAGDDTGSTYQKIARCYYMRGDKESAVTNYQNAISAYNKLIGAGRRVEEATAGLHVCEKMIKTCSL